MTRSVGIEGSGAYLMSYGPQFVEHDEVQGICHSRTLNSLIVTAVKAELNIL